MNPFLRPSWRQSLRPSATRLQLFAWLALILLAGCGYGEVSSTTYEYAKSLYSITNRRMSDRLPQARQQIVAAREAGELPDKEAAWLLKIVDRAEEERWSSAMKSCRRIMEDQVDFSQPDQHSAP